jgi:hypothetical protein
LIKAKTRNSRLKKRHWKVVPEKNGSFQATFPLIYLKPFK